MLWCLIDKIIFNFGFEKGVFLTKFHSYMKGSMDNSGTGLLHFIKKHNVDRKPNYSQDKHDFALLIHFRFESDYECICFVINDKTRSVPLTILSSALTNVVL